MSRHIIVCRALPAPSYEILNVMLCSLTCSVLRREDGIAPLSYPVQLGAPQAPHVPLLALLSAHPQTMYLLSHQHPPVVVLCYWGNIWVLLCCYYAVMRMLDILPFRYCNVTCMPLSSTEASSERRDQRILQWCHSGVTFSLVVVPAFLSRPQKQAGMLADGYCAVPLCSLVSSGALLSPLLPSCVS
jgi:hypothetical protein